MIQKNAPRFRRWTVATMLCTLGALFLCAVTVYAVDPFEHYRQARFYTPLYDNQIYCNSGIARHYTYDAVMVGSSMIENTRVSTLDACFGVQSVKLPFQGGYPYNYARVLDIAFGTHEMAAVFYALDVTSFAMPADSPSNPLPEYLWNDSLLDDVYYLLNAGVLIDEIGNTLRYNLRGDLPENPRDAMYTWTDVRFSREAALASYDFNSPRYEMTEPDHFAGRVLRNWELNLKPYLEAHPDTTFYLYFPPYSVIYWVLQTDAGVRETQLWAREQLAQWLLAYDNVRLFDFAAREEWTLDLDRYMDYSHHDPQMNEQIVRGMAVGENEVRDVAQVLAANESIRAAAESFERPY